MPDKTLELSLIGMRGYHVIRHLDSLNPARWFADAGVTAGQHAVLLNCDSHNLIDALEGRRSAAGLIRARPEGGPELAAAYVNRAALAQLIGETIDGYHRIIDWCANQRHGVVPVVLHLGGLTDVGGTRMEEPHSWLSAAYEAAGVPTVQRQAVTTYLYSKLAAALATLDCSSAQVYVLKQPGTNESALHAAARLIAR